MNLFTDNKLCREATLNSLFTVPSIDFFSKWLKKFISKSQWIATIFILLSSTYAYAGLPVPRYYGGGSLAGNSTTLFDTKEAACADYTDRVNNVETRDSYAFTGTIPSNDPLTFLCIDTESDRISGQVYTGVGLGTAVKTCNTEAGSNGTVGFSADMMACVCTSDSSQWNDLYRTCMPVIKKPQFSSPKSNGKQCPQCDAADPINTSNGNNWRTDTDYAAVTAPGGLAFSRTYNSNAYSADGVQFRTLGTSWTHSFNRRAISIPNPTVDTNKRVCYEWMISQVGFCAYPPLTASDGGGLAFLRPDGKSYTFGQVGSVWIGDPDVKDRVSATYGADGTTVVGWTYVTAIRDETEQYNGDGLLLSVTTRSGAVQTMTYSDSSHNDTTLGRIPANAPVCSNVQAGQTLPAGLLLCVTDNWGHQLQFEYDDQKRISRMIDPANQSYRYAYDGPSGGCATPDIHNSACSANNLTSVTYPDGNSITYWYNEASQINGGSQCSGDLSVGNGFAGQMNALTGIVDENGTRYASWTYDCFGRATGNQLAGGVNQTTITYEKAFDWIGPSTSTVSDVMGTAENTQVNVHNFSFQVVADVSKTTGTDKPCASCTNIANYSFDANANVTSTTDRKGNRTTYNYDLTRNLEISRTEAAGSPQARTITTIWHPTLRVPMQVSEPSRVTNYEYDTHGNPLSKTIQANSKSRKWTYEYNTVGQLTKITGPRTDVSDVSLYTYDANGNLATVTNALQQVTTLSNYDANGRVGLIMDPNGATTSFTYSPRGWLSAKIVHGDGIDQTTSYTYDNVGNMTRVVLPDNSAINYSYDQARRLIGISNDTGDSISYTLDLRGNRAHEQVNDSQGKLARQVSRSYDNVNRLQQITEGQ